MNQEEWLAERRRLGLPADPTKDFPPNFRENPRAADESRGRATQRRAPGAARGGTQPPASSTPAPSHVRTQDPGAPDLTPYQPPMGASGPFSLNSGDTGTTPYRLTPPPARAGKKSSPLAALAGAVIAVVAVGGGVVWPLVSNLTDQGSETNAWDTAWDDTDDVADTGTPTDAENEALEDVDAEVAKLLAGDSKAVDALLKRSNTSTSDVGLDLIKGKGPQAALGTDATFSADEATVYDTMGWVSGTLTSSRISLPVHVTVSRKSDADPWLIDSSFYSTLRVSSGGAESFTVDKQKVKANADGTTSLLTWPGQTTVHFPASKYVSWKKKDVSVSLGDAVQYGSMAYADPGGTANAAALKEVKRLAKANLDRCLKETSIEMSHCPFGGSLPSSVSKVRNVSYSLSGSPSGGKLTGELPRMSFSSSKNGSVKVHGQAYDGSWGTLTGTLDVAYFGSATITGNSVKYTEYDGN